MINLRLDNGGRHFVKIALLGYGRMGKKIFESAGSEENVSVLFAIDKETNERDKTLTVIKPSDFTAMIKKKKPEVIIDFSDPTASTEIAPIALSNGISMVVCTTGFSLEQQNTLKTLAEESKAALLLAPNITPGVNILMLFAKIASKTLS